MDAPARSQNENHSSSGFTLMELLIVITLIAILAGLVLDPFGSPMRYLADPPGTPEERRRTRNPAYDLWSLGGAEAGSSDFSDQSTWITNWSR